MCFPVIRENLIGTASNLNTVYCLHKYILQIYKLIFFLPFLHKIKQN
jgi:hypothetical protein